MQWLLLYVTALLCQGSLLMTLFKFVFLAFLGCNWHLIIHLKHIMWCFAICRHIFNWVNRFITHIFTFYSWWEHKIYTLRKFQLYSTISSIIVTTLCIRSSAPIHLMYESQTLLSISFHFPHHPHSLAITILLCFYEFDVFVRFHM